MNFKWILKQWMILALVFVSAGACALPFWHGPGGSGGGDPHAIEFLKLADNTLLWLKGTSDLKKIDRARFAREVEQLRNTLDIPILVPRIRFVEEPVICNGIPKIGCTVNRTVTINREEWKSLPLSQKYETVALEVFVLMEMMGNRYSYAQEVGKNARVIEKGARYRRENPDPQLILVSVAGASRFEGLNGIPVIYGGTQGSLEVGGCANRNPDSTCNNCVDSGTPGDAGLIACNRDRIFPELKLQLTLHSVSAEGFIKVMLDNGQMVRLAAGSDREISVNHTATIKIEWREICAAYDWIDESTCALKLGLTKSFWPLVISVGPNPVVMETRDVFLYVEVQLKQFDVRPGASLADTDCMSNGSYFDFLMFPGDESAYVEDARVCSSFPVLLDSEVRFIRMFYQPVGRSGFSRIGPNSPSFDVTVGREANLEQTRVDGLTNGVEYAFKAAFVDEAGNVAFYTPAAMDKPEHKATPEKVRGQVH